MPRSTARSILEAIGILLGAVAVAWILQAYIVKPFQIPTPSMVPTIDPGDRILVNRLAYRFGEIQRGDIIVFKAPPQPNVDFVKRVVALGGDTVEVRRGQLYVNGELQVEDYVDSDIIDFSDFPETTIPPGNVFVMGDNRANSEDARFWTPPWLPVENIIGKTFFVYWPPQRVGTLH